MSDYPDFLRVDQMSAVVLDAWTGLLTQNPQVRGPFYVGPFAGITYRDVVTAVGGGGCFPFIFFEWSDDPGFARVVGSFTASADVTTSETDLSLPNMGPWVRVTFSRNGVSNWTHTGVLLGQGHYYPDARGGNFSFGELVIMSGALAPGATITTTANLITKGIAHFHLNTTGSPATATLSARNAAGTFDPIAQESVPVNVNAAGEMVAIPPTLLQVTVANFAAGAINYNASLVLVS